jgi:hypothetical protein
LFVGFTSAAPALPPTGSVTPGPKVGLDAASSHNATSTFSTGRVRKLSPASHSS